MTSKGKFGMTKIAFSEIQATLCSHFSDNEMSKEANYGVII